MSDSMNINELVKKAQDMRREKGAWAPGNYYGTCFTCREQFLGYKYATSCAPCAYGDNKEVTEEEGST